jgi:hypothetical protein
LHHLRLRLADTHAADRIAVEPEADQRLGAVPPQIA